MVKRINHRGGGQNLQFNAKPGKTGEHFLENPHTSIALMLCIIMFISMWTIFSLSRDKSDDSDDSGDTKSFVIYEISMSVMAMVAAASGFAYLLLKETRWTENNKDGNKLVWGFPILGGLSLISWMYFMYKASNA